MGEIQQSNERPTGGLLRRNVPHHLYRCFGSDDQLLYIGITNCIAQRKYHHRVGTPWWPEVAEIKLDVYPDRASALHAEEVAIAAEAPLHNIKHNIAYASTAPARPGDLSDPERADSTKQEPTDARPLPALPPPSTTAHPRRQRRRRTLLRPLPRRTTQSLRESQVPGGAAGGPPDHRGGVVTARRTVRVGPWIVERVLTALAVGGLLSAVIAVGVLLAWS